jgi:Tfp pilus assembly protein PilO
MIIIAIVMMYNQIVVPHKVCLYAAQRHEAVLESVASTNEALFRNINQEKQKIAELQSSYIELKSRVCVPESVEKFVGSLQALARKAGCTVNSVNIVADKNDSKRKQAPEGAEIIVKRVQLSLVGEYGDVAELMKTLESQDGKVWLDSIKMKIISKDSSLLQCDMSISIYATEDKELRLNV